MARHEGGCVMAPLLALVAACVLGLALWWGFWLLIGVARWAWGG